jgi:hypothetical protein
MLIQSAAARGAVYEDDLGQSFLRVRTRQTGHEVGLTGFRVPLIVISPYATTAPGGVAWPQFLSSQPIIGLCDQTKEAGKTF